MTAYLLSLNPEASVADQWDFGLLKDILESIGCEFKPVDKLPKTDKTVVAVPARHHAGLEEKLVKEFKSVDNLVLFLLGDEEAELDIESLGVDPQKTWVQNPHPGKHDAYNKLGTGYPPHMAQHLPSEIPDKDLDLFFSGQLTHKRRLEMWDNLQEFETRGGTCYLNATTGFTRGVSPKDFYNYLVRAKLAPAPSGAVIPDSFRLFEALECMCVVVADDQNSQGTIKNYWNWLFETETPFYKINNTDEWVSRFNMALDEYPANLHKQTAWWIKYKRDLAQRVKELLNG